jgi:mannose-6-phosphate isomerase-like protein (cupin superfamily)
MFRGFQNVSDDEAYMVVVLGENDPGVITWTPKVIKDAKDTGMVLLNDNSLIDLDKQKIPEGKKALEPLHENDLHQFDHYTSDEIEKFVIRSSDSQRYIEDDEHFNSNSIINYLDELSLHEKTFKPHIPHHTGFGLSLLKGRDAHIHSYQSKKSEAFICLDGKWEITCDDQKAIIGPRDTFSAPKNSIRSVKQISEEVGSLFLVRQKN